MNLIFYTLSSKGGFFKIANYGKKKTLQIKDAIFINPNIVSHTAKVKLHVYWSHESVDKR